MTVPAGSAVGMTAVATSPERSTVVSCRGSSVKVMLLLFLVRVTVRESVPVVCKLSVRVVEDETLPVDEIENDPGDNDTLRVSVRVVARLAVSVSLMEDDLLRVKDLLVVQDMDAESVDTKDSVVESGIVDVMLAVPVGDDESVKLCVWVWDSVILRVSPSVILIENDWEKLTDGESVTVNDAD